MLLAEHGPLSPKELRGLGASAKSQPILSANVYGWFERQRRGVYTINGSGLEALEHYREVVESISRAPGFRSGDSKR